MHAMLSPARPAGDPAATLRAHIPAGTRDGHRHRLRTERAAGAARPQRRGAALGQHARVRRPPRERHAADRRGRGRRAAVAWAPHLAFPGMRAGEKLTRTTRMPERATIQARDGTPIAQGEERLSELDPLASEIAGRVGPAPPERVAELRALGVPADTPVGLTGLEREFDRRLAGTAGGILRAGTRALAVSSPRPGSSVRSTIDPEIQRAAVEALAGRYGGIAARAARATARCSPSRAWRSRRPSRPARCSRSSPSRARSRRARCKRTRVLPRRRRRPRSRASSWRTPTASRAAAR